MLIRVSVLNQQYLMILMYVINIIHIFQADNIEAVYFELNKMKYFYLTELRFSDTFFKVNLFVPTCLPGGIWRKEKFPAEPYSRFPPALKSCIDFINLQTCRVKLLFQVLVLHFCKKKKKLLICEKIRLS